SRRATASSAGSTSAPPSAPAAGGSGTLGSGPSGRSTGSPASSWCFMGFRFTKQSACRSARVVLAESVPVTGGLSSWFKKLAVRTARVNSDSSVRTGELRGVELRVDESQDVAHGALPLRVVQDFVIHLRVPAHLGCAREAIREGAPEVRVYDAVFTREQQQEGAFDPLGVGDDGPLRPLDLAPRAGRYHVVDRRIL